MSDLTGQTIGQYEVLGLIGKGGMASVYRARQPSMGRIVALKILPNYFMHEETFLKRFQREAQAIARLQHPRILPVYDYGEDRGIPYIAMAYVEGGSLSQVIQEEGGLSLDEASRLLDQIAEGLDFAHERGVIHRDFKPSNVLMDGKRNVYLADFGIAKVSYETAQLTGSGIVGTPAYMAPEMFKSEPISHSIDLYALGVTLYQILSGSAPFEGTTPVQLMYAHLNQPVPNIAELKEGLPSDIQTVLDTAMAKNPEERYPNAGALAEAFRDALEGKSLEIDTSALPAMAPTMPGPAEPLVADDSATISIVEPEVQPPSEKEARRAKRRAWWQRNGRVVGAALILFFALVAWLATPGTGAVLLMIFIGLIMVGFHLQKRNWWQVALWAGVPSCGGMTALTIIADKQIAYLFAVILTLVAIAGLIVEIVAKRKQSKQDAPEA
jgi:serine/threonine protein kinase